MKTKPFNAKDFIRKALKGFSSVEQLEDKQLKVVVMSKKRNIKNIK